MFRKLRLQFIAVASLSILVVLVSVVGVINSARFVQTTNEIRSILTVLSSNGGSFPSTSDTSSTSSSQYSEDSLYGYRYFSGIYSSDGNLSSLDVTNISEITEETATKKLAMLFAGDDNKGRFTYNDHTYYYQITEQSDASTLIVVLDATTRLDNTEALLEVSFWISAAGMVFFIGIFTLFSGKIIKPFVENYEKQRRFITNASHELKTPLAIISANNELVEIMAGESEWTKSTGDQVNRLTGLINGMVALARLEEQPEMVLSQVDFSAIAEDAAEDFKGPVIRDGKTFVMEIQPDIHVKAEEKSLFELVTILVDNANKYCDDGGKVTVKLKRSNRLTKAKLEISNTYAAGKHVDYSKFFERFYREDTSHNSQVSGYGIGLSMAQTMVKLFKGTLSVSYKEDTLTFSVHLS